MAECDSDQPFGPGAYEDRKGPWPEASRELRDYVVDFLQNSKVPEGMRGLSWAFPRMATGYVKVGEFDVRGRRLGDDPVKCSFAAAKGQTHPPLHGSVMWFPDGFIRLVGSRCARKHFPDAERLDRAFADFRSRRTRDGRERTVKAIKTQAGPLLEEIRATIKAIGPTLESYEWVRQRMDSPEFEWVRRQIHRLHRGDIMTTYKSGNRERSAFAAALGDQRGQRDQTEGFGRLRGVEVIRKPANNPRQLLKRAETELSKLVEQVGGLDPETMSDEMLARVDTSARSAVRAALRARWCIAEMKRFTAPDNMRRFCRYLNRLDGDQDRFRAAKSGFGFDTDTDSPGVGLRAGYQTIDLPEARRFALIYNINPDNP